ncbi:MAG: redoxin domain-containing protein [Ignavibacteria bacterium]|jgi:peroxiredoxin
MALSIGQSAPDFTLVDNSLTPHTLSSYKGQSVILAFFPAAFTGVCEKEMCTFRDNLGSLQSSNARIFGISVDLPFSADTFAKKNDLNFPILSDMNREVTKAYDVLFPNLANVQGLDVSARAVFLIDGEGVIRYAEVTANPGVEPDYEAVMAAAAAL